MLGVFHLQTSVRQLYLGAQSLNRRRCASALPAQHQFSGALPDLDRFSTELKQVLPVHNGFETARKQGHQVQTLDFEFVFELISLRGCDGDLTGADV
jgi:hypothetical protein